MVNQSSQSENTRERELIIDYLYREMSDEARQDFERRLRNEPQLREQLEQQQLLEVQVRFGTKPQISERRMQGVSWSLHKRLQQKSKDKLFLLQPLVALWQSRVAFKVQLASVAIAFIVGMIASDRNWIGGISTADDNRRETPLALIKSGDYQITDLQLKKLNADNGDVHLVYSLASQTHLNGNLSDSEIQSLLSTTILNDVSDATRLDLVELLQDYTRSTQVQKALGHSLLNDPNPGVRMVAAQSLVKLAGDEGVKTVLRKVLVNEVNSGIRVAVFDAMLPYLTAPDSKKILEKLSVDESNPYIRSTAKNLLTNLRKPHKIRI